MLRICISVLFVLLLAPTLVLAQSTKVTVSHSVVNVTTSTGEVIAVKSNRGFLLLINDSDTDIYCKVNASAVLNEGLRLNANSGSWEMSRGGRNLDTRAVNCIHGGTGNKVMLVTEG